MAHVLATLHLADLFRDPKMRLPTRADYRKIPRILAGEWPKPIPPRTIATTPEEIAAWVHEARDQTYLVVDTEFDPETKRLWLWGVGGPTMPTTLQVWRSQSAEAAWTAAGEAMVALARHTPIVYQNAMADLPVMAQAWGLTHADHRQVEDCMLLHAVLWSELPHDLEFLASLYSQHPKLKHLAQSDPIAYHQGDLLATLDVWAALHEEAQADPQAWAVYREQSLALIPTLLAAEAAGIRVNEPRVRSALVATRTQRDRASNLAQAYAGWPLNVGSNAQLTHALYTEEGLAIQRHKDTKQPTVNADAIATLRGKIDPPPDTDREADEGLTWDAVVARVDAGAHPLLEARVLYADAQQTESHYLRPAEAALAQNGRLYPRMMIHTQETGRWSIVDPPLQQLPKDLRDLIVPDTLDVWIGWDWSGIEEVLLGALSGETVILDAVREGKDLHAQQAEAIFGAKARGREDYRTFTKRFKYRLYYLGDPASAANIPGARALGLSGPHLVTLSRSLLSTMPRLAAYRDRTLATIHKTGRARTFMGRPRMAVTTRPGDFTRPPAKVAWVRELWNHQFQGGVADILNTTVVAIIAALPWARLVYTAHDAGTLTVPIPRLAEAFPVVREIVTRPIDVFGRMVRFPAKFTLTHADGTVEKI